MPATIAILRKLFDSVIDDVEAGFLQPDVVARRLKDIKENHSTVSKHFEHFLKALFYGSEWRQIASEKVAHISNTEAQLYLDNSELADYEVKILRLFFGIDDPLARPAQAKEVGQACNLPQQLIVQIVRAALMKIRRKHGIKVKSSP